MTKNTANIIAFGIKYALAIETVVNILFASLILILVSYVLGKIEFGKYSEFLAFIVIFNISNLGSVTIMPKWSLDRTLQLKLKNAIALQGIITAATSIGLIYIIREWDSIKETESIGAINLIVCALYAGIMQVDEIIHSYWRLGNQELTSSKFSIATRSLQIALVYLIMPSNAIDMLYLITSALFLMLILKYAVIANKTFNKSEFNILIMIDILKSVVVLWPANVSNSVFNGIGRLIISSTYGALILGFYTLVMQVNSSLQAIFSSITLKKLKEILSEGKLDMLNFEKIDNVLVRISIIIFALNLASGVIYFDQYRQVNLEKNEFISYVLVFSVSFIAASPFAAMVSYQVAQFNGSISRIATVNLSVAIASIILMKVIVDTSYDQLSVLFMVFASVVSLVYIRIVKNYSLTTSLKF